MILVLCFHSTLQKSYIGPNVDLSRDNAQLVFGSMAASDPITPKTCAGPLVATRFDINMEGSLDSVGQGGVVSIQVIGVEGLAVVVGVVTVPQFVSGGPGVSTAAQERSSKCLSSNKGSSGAVEICPLCSVLRGAKSSRNGSKRSMSTKHSRESELLSPKTRGYASILRCRLLWRRTCVNGI